LGASPGLDLPVSWPRGSPSAAVPWGAANKRQGCSIINITSILGSRVAGGVSPYIASKARLKALTQAMALGLAWYGIRVNSLAPGYIATHLNEDFLNSEAGQRLRQRIPERHKLLHRWRPSITICEPVM
jgi:NAD(P)-dependent dehydrogenase (short-subunit alcohol dehydrogenase family)